MPPKHDESSAPDAGAADAKKTPRRRTSRLTRSRSSAAPKAEREPVTEAAPAAVAEPAASVFPPEPPRPEPPPAAPAAPAAESPAPAPSTNGEAQPQGGGTPGTDGGNAEYHERGGGGGGGGGGGRDFWKRNKRKRGRHGGHWQQGGPREQHPPQPPPPSNTPVYGELPNPSRFGDLAALATLAGEIASDASEPIWLNDIYAKNLADLTAYARECGLTIEGAPNRKELLARLVKSAAEQKRPIRDRGYIDLTDRGAFIVHEHVNYRLYPEDAYLPEILIKSLGLKRGHRVEVLVQAPLEGERCPSVIRVDSVMGLAPADIGRITPFEELIPYYPLQRVLLENTEIHTKDVSMRAVDILTPIGFGQRALIVAPPRTGKTILLQNIANSISANSPHAKLILLLVDERPEEVTDFKRHTKGEVVSSTFDETPESHVHCAEMVIENARRRVELGEHVVILLDSITRLARAYNALASNSGKIMSGGLEANALQKPKRFFGSARNIEGGGSLTIIASALIDTGSRMDEIIFEEFKGTGNCELHLDRGLVERRIFPAINIDRSGTRKEELIYHPEELQRIYGLRRAMQGLGPIESMEMLITRLKKTKSNAEFLLALGRT
ncbi:MAG TPA: transcription termination factor Rho [Opitutus sp.]|nr:transcription termination factor Rho [Opitutus sp.]